MDILILLSNNTNWVDVCVVICLIRTSYMGYSRGFAAEFPRLLSLILVIVLTYHFYGRLGQFLSAHSLLLMPPQVAERVSFASLVVLFMLFFMLLCRILRFVIRISGPHAFDVIGGVIIGIARGILLASLILVILQFLFPTYLNKSIYEGSFSGRKVINLAPKTYEFVSGFKSSPSIEGY